MATNTVIVGQKVSAKVESSLEIVSCSWSTPTGGSYVKNYETDENAGVVTYLTQADYSSGTLDFYYTSNSYHCGYGGLSASLILTDANGKTYGRSDSVSYYLDAPTVNSFSSQWASYSNGESPVGIRISEDKEALKLGGLTGWFEGNDFIQESSPGIEWTASVTAPQYGGTGTLAYCQLVNSQFTPYIGSQINTASAVNTNGYWLDNCHPYGGMNESQPLPAGQTKSCFNHRE